MKSILRHAAGTLPLGSKTAEYFRTRIELPFFNRYLKDKGRADLREAIVFETGGNRWHQYDRWPPVNARSRNIYVQADLSREGLGLSKSDAQGVPVSLAAVVREPSGIGARNRLGVPIT